MYSLAQLKKGLKAPRSVIMKLNSLYYRGLSDEYNHSGIDIFDEDWDTLIILDSCRYDTFAELCDLKGHLECRTSRGGGTKEFLKGNLKNRILHDTVYVTENPQFYYHQQELDAEFHDVWNVWQDGWDEELRTVPPAVTTEAALRAVKQYPNKQLLIHYNQPHAPYIGPTGQSLTGLYGRMLKEDTTHTSSFLSGLVENIRQPIDPKKHQQAFRENLEVVLPHVEKLLDELQGLTVVTADHGKSSGNEPSLSQLSTMDTDMEFTLMNWLKFHGS